MAQNPCLFKISEIMALENAETKKRYAPLAINRKHRGGPANKIGTEVTSTKTILYCLYQFFQIIFESFGAYVEKDNCRR